jgi:mRNA interferase MazF
MASTEPRRGQVWLANFGPARPGEPGKNRPAVVMSVDGISTGHDRDLFVLVPFSSTLTESQLRPIVPAGTGGIDRESVAVPRAIRALARTRLLEPLGDLPDSLLGEVERVLRMILGLA